MTYRVIQWATGNIGGRALRHVIEHPDYELAGLYSTGNAGRDAGEIAGIQATGVIATASLDEIVATPADCVLYMRQGMDPAEVCAILASGKNIVTTRGEFHHPGSMDAGLRKAVEEACAKGGTSIYSTGSSPGFISEALAIPLLAQQRWLDHMQIDEFADCSGRDSPDMIFNIMGFGKQPGDVDDNASAHVKYGFGGTLGQIAEATGKPIDDFEVTAEFGFATRDIEIAAGTVPKGTMAAQRFDIQGLHKGKPVLGFRANWYVSKEIDQDWDLRDTGWRVQVQGDVPMDLSITFPIEPENYDAMTPGITANRAVNAVPAICAAEPGIRTTVDLPQVIPAL